MRSITVGVAVSISLAMAAPIRALGPSEPVAIRLVVAGSLAQRDNVRYSLATLCEGALSLNGFLIQQTAFPFSGSGSSSFNTYYADDPSLRGGPSSPSTALDLDPDWDFRAYTCKLKTGVAASVIPTAIQGQNVAVYYRAEGDSGYAVGALAKNLQLLRLNTAATGTSACAQWTTDSTSGAPTNAFYCPVTEYNLNTDTANAGSALVNDSVQLAVADVEPLQFRGVHWPSTSKLGAEPAASVLTALNNAASVSTGLVLGVIISPFTSGASAGGFSKRQLSSIFSGLVADWSEVGVGGTGAGIPIASGPITICRLQDGSGPQIQAGIYFLHEGCGGLSFVTEPAGPGGNPVIYNATVDAVKSCVLNNPGAIGIVPFDGITPPFPGPTYHYAFLDAAQPGKVSAAGGDYGGAFEGVLVPASGLPTAVSQLSTALRTAVRTQNGGFATAVNTYISPLVMPPTIPINATRPVATYTYVKNSCVP